MRHALLDNLPGYTITKTEDTVYQTNTYSRSSTQVRIELHGTEPHLHILHTHDVPTVVHVLLKVLVLQRVLKV